MSDGTLDREIIEAVQKLDRERKQRVLEFIRSLEKPQAVSADWFERVEAFQAELRAKYGDDFVFGVQSMLDEVREERLNDLMGGR